MLANTKEDTKDICEGGESEVLRDTDVPANHFQAENLPNALESRVVKIEQDLKDLQMQLDYIKMYGGVPEPSKAVVQ